MPGQPPRGDRAEPGGEDEQRGDETFDETEGERDPAGRHRAEGGHRGDGGHGIRAVDGAPRHRGGGEGGPQREEEEGHGRDDGVEG